MSVLDDIKGAVKAVAEDRGFADEYKAFGYWFLEEIEDFSAEEAQDLVVDGPWDHGRDAVHLDEDERALRIFQFKYSETSSYVEDAFNDIQRAAIAELPNMANVDRVAFVVVTIAESTSELERRAKTAEASIRRWFKKHAPHAEPSVEFIDRQTFAQLYEKLYGIEATIRFKTAPLRMDGALLGFLNVADLKDRVGEEELFAFNIRKFLGLRKGSVNAQIRNSLDDYSERNGFWMLNNGIVCLCTDFESTRWRSALAGLGEDADASGKTALPGEPADPTRRDPEADGLGAQVAVTFRNFTVVNGAQTVNTIARFLRENPTDEDPVWVVAKVIRVEETAIDRARLLTKTSNTQSPTSNKDLKAVDLAHPRVRLWLDREFGMSYIYRRGDRAPRGVPTVNMKDLAQAYIAYWTDEPNVPFSRVGAIFSGNTYYDLVFPGDEIEGLRASGSPADVKAFLLDRLAPWALLVEVRGVLKTVATADEERKWRSVAYHLVWIYRQLLQLEGRSDPAWIFANAHAIVGSTFADLYDGLQDFCQNRSIDIPRDLKSAELVEQISAKAFLEQAACRRARTTIQGL
jgi:AIPR protein